MTTCAVDKAWADAVAAVFPHEYSRMYAAVCSHPEPETLAKLLLDLSNYKIQPSDDLPSLGSKKRKLGDEPPSDPRENGLNGHSTVDIANPSVAFECKDVSFQMPSRKRLKLQLVSDTTDARKADVSLVHPQTGEIEYSISTQRLDQVFCLPVPEKQQRQWNFCLVPIPGAIAKGDVLCEQVVFTMNETPPVGASVTGGENDTYVSVTEKEINALLSPLRKQVVRPSEAEFASSIPQPHRKGEKAYHIKAHRGSKDGYLFLLSKGVLFGFKKPLSFFPLDSIDAISYTSVLQRTFNLIVTVSTFDDEGTSTGTTDTEFSMLDQADFAGIDDYLKRHGLNDASMAQERRAKAYNVTKVKKEEGALAEGAEVEDGQTELQKAEQSLQDQEDEEEEDYEASGGESDGEGESSEEDGEDGGDGGGEEEEFDEDEEVDQDQDVGEDEPMEK